MSLARRVALGAALVLLCGLAYSGASGNLFLNYDDDVYVTGNGHVTGGFCAEGVSWALTSFHAANWHPLTWISHMIDVSVFGLHPGGHHLVNVLLHVVNTLLLFAVFARMTGAVWRPALVAALFAVHPLHVESVAWIAERKDVLSTLFWLLTIAAYVRYTESKTPGRYAAVVVLYCLGLMSKPMLVTLPLTLMLLDVWPLGRVKRPTLWREKAPLFALAAGSAILTVIAQRRGGAVQSLAGLGMAARIANAAEAYAWYLWKTAWPASLACFYPHPGHVRLAGALAGAAVVALVTIAAVRFSSRAPYLAFGWAWYVITLVPVIGIVQVGAQAVADRYTYVPSIGVFVAIAWGLGAAVSWRPSVRPVAVAAGAVAIAVLIPLTRAQVGDWHDNHTLFDRALAVTSNNALAHNNFGLALFAEGHSEQAVAHYNAALAIKPDYLEALNNLGSALHSLGRDQEAANALGRALQVTPDSPAALVNMGNALAGTGRPDEAIAMYSHALQVRPGDLDAQKNLGLLFDRMGRHDEAIAALMRALAMDDHDAATHLGLATALADAGRPDEAMPHFAEALRLKPDFPEGYNGYGIALAAVGRNDEAIARYTQAIALRPGYAEAHNNLGLALAATGHLAEAVPHFQRAIAESPGFAQAHNNLGVTLARLNRVPEAIAQLGEAVRLDPSLSQAKANLERLQGASH